MSKSPHVPPMFGGIDDEKYSNYGSSRIVISPVCGVHDKSVRLIIEASQKLELYEEETDAEVYKIGIHTLNELPYEASDKSIKDIYDRSKEIVSDSKFLFTIGADHAISVPLIRIHAEKHYNLSVLQIDSHPDLYWDTSTTPFSSNAVMAHVVKVMRVPAVQVGIRSISANEAVQLDENLPTKIFWAKDIFKKPEWIDTVIGSLTGDVYLTIDISALDPSLINVMETPEPGGLGWFQILTLMRKVANKHRIVGMDLMNSSIINDHQPSAYICAKLIYKCLAYIFKNETSKVRKI